MKAEGIILGIQAEVEGTTSPRDCLGMGQGEQTNQRETSMKHDDPVDLSWAEDDCLLAERNRWRAEKERKRRLIEHTCTLKRRD